MTGSTSENNKEISRGSMNMSSKDTPKISTQDSKNVNDSAKSKKTSEEVPAFKHFNTLDDWTDRYEFDKQGWTLAHPNPYLVKYFHLLQRKAHKLNAKIPDEHELKRGSASKAMLAAPDDSQALDRASNLVNQSTRDTCNEDQIRVLVPLCGKTRDLKWLLDQGVEVIGVEWCINVVDELFHEAGLAKDSDVEESESCLLKEDSALSGAFRVLQGDFFALNEINLKGPVDAVWDRDAFSAVNLEDRKRYVDVLKAVLKPGAKILMDTPQFDSEEYDGDPHPVSDGDLMNFFEDFHIEFLESSNELDESWSKCGLTAFDKRLHLLTWPGTET